jgi:NAD(P)-dependent dehydrogenase (short-subunit alcohol dehydrogenase family)
LFNNAYVFEGYITGYTFFFTFSFTFFFTDQSLFRGVMAPPVEQKTANGYDLQFGTKVLGHYFFTTLLLPTLIHTGKRSPLSRKFY